MSNIDLPTIRAQQNGESIEEYARLIASTLARIIDDLDFIFRNIDSKNVRNIAGYNVTPYDIMHISGLVGMSGYDAGNPEAIRFWSGDVKEGNPKFKVTQAGILTVISGLFKSAMGFPRVELNSDDNLIAAYSDEDTYVAFIPSGVNSVPALVCVDVGTTKSFLNRTAAGGTTLGTFDGEPLNLQPSGNLQIGGVNGYNGSITYVKNVISGTPITGTITVTKGIITSVS